MTPRLQVKVFIPRDTFVNSPNHQLYEKFYNEGSLTITEGNIQDYQLITNKIVEISQIIQIEGIYYDQYNSSQWAIQCTNLGFNMQPFSQGLMAFNNPTKELERLILSRKAVIDKNILFLWEMDNTNLRVDHAGNVKPEKKSSNQKIDAIIATIQAIGGFLKNPAGNDFEIFVL